MTTKRVFTEPTHRFAMLMTLSAFDKLCKMARTGSLAATIEEMIEREYQRTSHDKAHHVPYGCNR